MKRLLPIMKVLILFLIVPNSLYAYDFESGGIYYGILNDGVNVSVTSGSTEYQGDIVIPSVVTYKDKSYNVTNISWDAFMGCHGLTSVKIPKSMRYIGDNAFLYCDNLTAVYISDLEAFMNISFSMGDYPSNPLFYAQHLYLNGVEIIDLVIPNQITRINSYAFINCSSLKSVTIPNSVTSIGTNAFLGCSGLTAIVSEIEKPFGLDGYVFSDDIYANAELIVPTGTKTAYQATEGWNKFTKIVEYEKRKTIHVATAGTLPDLIQNYEKNLIEELALTGELNGTDFAFLREMAGRSRWIWFHFENANIFDLKSGEGLTLETQGKLINLDISNATIVSGGGPSLQLQGTGFTNIYSSDNTIPAGLFHDCRLTSIKLPQNVSIIESLAFGNCPLTSIIIPSSVEIIGRSAFWGCSSLESIVVENGNTKYDSRNNCEAIIETESNTLIAGCKNTIIPSNVTSIGNEAFEDCSGLTSVTIPNSVTSIGLSAFEGCSGLTSITIPSSVTSIGDWAFSVCIGLNSVTIPNSVTSIGRSAFSGCSGLTSVSIPNSVTSIGNGVFNSCSGLTSVTIGNSVTSIGDYAFYGCSGLTTIVSEIDKPFKIENTVFNGIPSDAQLIVPKGTKVAYQSTEGWNRFTNIVEDGDDSTINGKGGESVYYIYEKDTHTLTIYGEGSMYSLDQEDWYPWWSFHDDIQHIIIESGVTNIGSYAFWLQSSLTSIVIPNSITHISIMPFNMCTNLTTIISEIECPFEIYEDVFNTIPSDAQLIVPQGTKAAYQATKGWNRFTNIVEAGGTGPDQSGQIQINDIYYKLTESGEAEVFSADNGVTSITIPSNVSHNNTSYKVMAIAKDAFEDCEHLAAVIWEPEVQFNAKVNNPNFLLYVSDEKYASRSVKNVVVNGVAESIELTDAANGNDFYCPRAFRARNIVFSHNYQMETGIGDSRGWETIVLPFDVQKYTHATKGELEPFTTWSKGGSKKPFWLFELTASGYKDVAGIKANTPYIISMPNNQQYEQQYQIPGIVTFSASDVEVQKSDNLKPGSYQGRSLVPNYTNKSDENYLALNVSNNYVTNPGKDISGSKFVRGLRAVHPFEAHMTTTDNTRSIDVMEGMTTAIRGILMVNNEASGIKVYDTRGVLMKTATSMDDVRNELKAGVYIVNGKKIVIK